MSRLLPKKYRYRRKPVGGQDPSRSDNPEHLKVVSGLYYLSGPPDPYNQKPAPTMLQLVQMYRGFVYFVANMVCQAVATTPLRLYVTTARRQSRPKCLTKAVSRERLKYLESDASNYVKKAVSSAASVEEVVEHPLLDLLNNPNPWMTKTDFLEILQLYREVVGPQYIYTESFFGLTGPPHSLWILPSWLVYPIIDPQGDRIVSAWSFSSGGGYSVIDPLQVLYGSANSLYEPYVGTLSPVRACFELCRMGDMLTSYEVSVLENRGRPDAALEISDSLTTVVSPEEIRRLEADFRQNFTRSQEGRLYVAPGGTKLTPLNWSPRDMGEIAQNKETLNNIARTFGVPTALVDSAISNKAALDGALLQFARFAVRPRCRHSEEYLNKDLTPRFDERLFLAYDDVVPADQALMREDHKAYFSIGAITVNEIRLDRGLPPVEGGDTLFIPSNMVPLDHALRPPAPAIIPSLGAPKPDEEPDEVRNPASSDPLAGQDVSEGSSVGLDGEDRSEDQESGDRPDMADGETLDSEDEDDQPYVSGRGRKV